MMDTLTVAHTLSSARSYAQGTRSLYAGQLLDTSASCVCVCARACVCVCVCVQSHSVVGILADEADPMVSVMKVSTAPAHVFVRHSFGPAQG